MLPETVFQFATNTGQSKVKRDAGLFRSGDFHLKNQLKMVDQEMYNCSRKQIEFNTTWK